MFISNNAIKSCYVGVKIVSILFVHEFYLRLFVTLSVWNQLNFKSICIYYKDIALGPSRVILSISVKTEISKSIYNRLAVKILITTVAMLMMVNY